MVHECKHSLFNYVHCLTKAHVNRKLSNVVSWGIYYMLCVLKEACLRYCADLAHGPHIFRREPCLIPVLGVYLPLHHIIGD